MTNAAHIPTKSQCSLDRSRAISKVIVSNPASTPINNYRTEIDPALLMSKLVPVDRKVLDQNQDAVPAWMSYYNTGINSAQIHHKASINAGGKQIFLVGDAPYIDDLGPVVDFPLPPTPVTPINPNQLDNDWHENVVTDLAPSSTTIIVAATVPSFPGLFADAYRSQLMLYPISSRHTVKTSNGTIHAVCAYTISGLSRIVHLKSTNGGNTWSSEIVDSGEAGMHYFSPSITCDRADGIHITFSRWDSIICNTYWLADSSSTPPAGFELVSGAGSEFGSRILAGGAGTFTDLALNQHRHGYTIAGGDVNEVVEIWWIGASDMNLAMPWWHHTTATTDMAYASSLPPYYSMEVYKYNGIPPYIPAGFVLPFNVNVPAGFTRYSALDNKYILGGDTSGVTGGADSHLHAVTGSLSGSNGECLESMLASATKNGAHCNHVHAFSLNSVAANTPIPTHSVIFGKVDSDITTIPVGALVMSNAEFVRSGFTYISGAGGVLNNLSLYGDVDYHSHGAVTTTHNHPNISGWSNSPTTPSCGEWSTFSPDSYGARCVHKHSIQINNLETVSHVPSQVLPYISAVTSAINMSTFGNDVFYRYISPAGVMSSVVNISAIYKYFPQTQSVCLADSSDNVSVAWSAQGLNTTMSNARICYKKKTGAAWGARVDVTTADEDKEYPSMDIDTNNDVHLAWYESSPSHKVQYNKFVAGAPGAIENVDTSNYVGFSSNVLVDRSGNAHLTYAKISSLVTPVPEILYRKRSGGVWSAASNLSPGMEAAGYSQFPGHLSLDAVGNLLVTWSGKGYGAHPAVYHPVYRYITPDGTITPSLASPAADMFPLDDSEMISPNLFWHNNPYIDGVYHNLPVYGFSVLFLDNVSGASKQTADIVFCSFPNAIVGDSGPLGLGGVGDNMFTPGGVGSESMLQQETYSIITSGHICLNHISRNPLQNSIS